MHLSQVVVKRFKIDDKSPIRLSSIFDLSPKLHKQAITDRRDSMSDRRTVLSPLMQSCLHKNLPFGRIPSTLTPLLTRNEKHASTLAN